MESEQSSAQRRISFDTLCTQIRSNYFKSCGKEILTSGEKKGGSKCDES